MPQLSDITEKRVAKKFTKRDYRPWDLSGTGIPNSNNPVKETPLIENVIDDSAIKPDNQTQENTVGEVTRSSDNAIDNIKTTQRQPLENNEITARKHLDNFQTTMSKQNDNYIDNVIDNNVDNNIEVIRNLTGIQEKMFFYIVDVCSARGQSDTGHLLTSDLATVANCSIRSAKTSLERLINKKLIIRKKGKRSKGGYVSLHVLKEIQSAAVQAKMVLSNLIAYANLQNNSSNIDNSKVNALVNINTPSSSRLNINKTTTTDLPESWKKIDFTNLKDINFGLIEIINIYKKAMDKITSDQVQDSINQFAFGLSHNPTRYKNMSSKCGVLVKSLMQGNLWIETGYVSQEEKSKKEKNKKITEMLENQFQEAKFLEWFNSLSDREKEENIPEEIKRDKDDRVYGIQKQYHEKTYSKQKYLREIWPKMLLELKGLLEIID